MDRELEEYILEYSTPEDPVLEDLFRQTHLRFVNPNRASGHLQGKFLEMISRMINPEAILEIGTFTGYSAICLASGLRPGGKLITVESDDELDEFARSYFRKAGVENKIEKITGRLQDVITTLNEEFDLVFIDGDKREYCEYYELVIGKVRPGGFIIADNVLWGGKVTDKNTRDQQTRGIIEFNEMIRKQDNVENYILPLRDGLMIIRKK
ncbi:MAG TPA: O-methyltransferase [Bacteroidales bacterium]|jgi:predicted O-methyltransferase YrrM|nr:O-methyltransferase [Bacteroidales bacterium]